MQEISNMIIIVRSVSWRQKISSSSFLRRMVAWTIKNTKCYITDKIDVSEGIDFNKTSESRGCITCRHWYFLD